MKIFIDTANKRFIAALIDQNNKVRSIVVKNTNNNVVKNANYWLDQFLNKNKLTLADISEAYITIGPGSFTGVKVAFNIVQSIFIMEKNKKINVIDSFDFQVNNERYSVIQVSKSKYIAKDYKLNKIFETKDLSEIKDYTFNPKITKKFIEEKIAKQFSKTKINEVKLIYYGEIVN